MIYRFNRFVLDRNNYTLMDNGSPVILEPQVFDLLVFLIEHRERLVSRQEILDALWTGKVVTESALSNRIKMARAAVGDNGHDQQVIKTVHGRGYQFVATIKDPTIKIAPKPLVDGSTILSIWSNRRFLFSVIALMSLITLSLMLILFNQQNDKDNSEREKSIAVLPFENSSMQADDVYFTDGIHGDLLAQISRIKGIKSISRTSVMSYRGSDKNLQKIANELGVAIILEGGVQRSGKQVRIHIQLIDAKKDVPFWSLTYTRDLTAENIFQIQTEIASAIAQKLKAELVVEEFVKGEALPTQNLAALELYFKAKSETEKASSIGYQQAVEYLQQAIAIDQRFTNAYIELARIYLEQTFYGGLPRDEQLQLAHELIEKAKMLEGDTSTILSIDAQYTEYNNQHLLAEQKYQRAIALNPNNVFAYANYAHLQNWIFADYAESIRLFEIAVSLDPLNLNIQQQLAEALTDGGHAERAIQVLKDIVAKAPNLPTAWLGQCRIYAEALYQFDKAIQACHMAASLDPSNPFISAYLAITYGNLGEMELMADFSQRAYKLSPTTWTYLGEKLYAEDKLQDALAAFYKVKKGTIYFRHCNGYVAALGLQQDIVGALQYFKDNYPELINVNTSLDLQTIYPAYYFAKLLEKSGDHLNASSLINRGIAYLSKNLDNFALQEYPIMTNYYLAAGQKDKAFSLLAQFVERGGAVGRWALVGSMANLLIDFPVEPTWNEAAEYKNLMATMEARLAQQRINVTTLKENGELMLVPQKSL